MSNTLKFGNGEWYGKEGTILAYNDENKNYKPLPFTFDRASSATLVNKDGLIETVGADQPRVDYLNNSKGALLLEPSRTNLITYSEDFTQWGKLIDGSGILPIVTSNFTISPDGTQNADKIVFSRTSSGGSDYTLIKSDYGGADINGTASIYLKAESNVDIEITSDDLNYKTINVTTDWKRFEVSDITSDRLTFGLRGSEPSTLNATVYAWGGQLEEGSYATSYIPTSGSAVTRLQDSCSQTPPSGIIGQTEGVIYWEGVINGTENNFANIVTGERNTTTSFSVLHRKNPSQFQCSVFDGSTKGICIGGSVVLGENYKIAYAYKSGDFSLYVNGILVDTSTDTWTPPSTIDEIIVGDATTYFGFKESNSHKDIRLYNTRLSNAELAALTQM